MEGRGLNPLTLSSEYASERLYTRVVRISDTFRSGQAENRSPNLYGFTQAPLYV